jgi:hypothetical protein
MKQLIISGCKETPYLRNRQRQNFIHANIILKMFIISLSVDSKFLKRKSHFCRYAYPKHGH